MATADGYARIRPGAATARERHTKEIEEDIRSERRIVNIREQRLAKPWRNKYKRVNTGVTNDYKA